MKENDKIGYVYLTTNLVNGKQYVGQHHAVEFDTFYKGSGSYILNALNKYGRSNFKCQVICWCTTQTQLNEAEDNYIKLLGTMYPKGYNLKEGGYDGKYSVEARMKMSIANKGRKLSDKQRKENSERLIKTGEKTRFKEGHTPWNKGGNCYKEEQRKNMGRKKGSIPWNKGLKGVVKDSEETRKKKSESNKGKHHGSTGKPAWNKGLKMSKEFCEKVSNAHKGQIPWNKKLT